MKVINCRWRDLRAKEAQLKSYMENSERILKVHPPLISFAAMTLSCTTTSPLERLSRATARVQASLVTAGVRNRAGRARGFVPWMWKALVGLGQQAACPAPSVTSRGHPPGRVSAGPRY